MSRNLLITLADEHYLDQAKQLFASAYFNAGWQYDFGLLAHEIPEEKLTWFRNKNIYIKHCKRLTDEPVGLNTHPPVILDKLYIFTPEFQQYDHILFLDADMIIKNSLEPLTHIHGFAAANLIPTKLSEHWTNHKHIDETRFQSLITEIKQSYDQNALTFNSGVMAFSTDIITGTAFSKLVRLLEKYGDISRSAEETVLNLFFHKKWAPLSPAYNLYPEYMTQRYGILPQNIDGIIFHFMFTKPWSCKNNFSQEWADNLKRAELIDPDKKPPYVKPWLQWKIIRFSIMIHIRSILNIHYLWDKFLGCIGNFLKHRIPVLYRQLKKVMP